MENDRLQRGLIAGVAGVCGLGDLALTPTLAMTAMWPAVASRVSIAPSLRA